LYPQGAPGVHRRELLIGFAGRPARPAYGRRPPSRALVLACPYRRLLLRANDPEALPVWYEERLGITRVPQSYDDDVWRQQEGVTVIAPFPRDSEMIGPPEQTWMINFRVDDLDAMAEQLRLAGGAS
jgi:hypothetical protein